MAPADMHWLSLVFLLSYLECLNARIRNNSLLAFDKS